MRGRQQRGLKGRAWQRFAACAALAGFLFHIALELSGAFLTRPLLAAAKASASGAAAAAGVAETAADDQGSAELPFRAVLLCTAEGLKRIVLDANGVPLGGLGPDPHDTCPVCDSHSAVFPVPAANLLVLPVRIRAAVLRPVGATVPRRADPVHTYLSRAPPRSVPA